MRLPTKAQISARFADYPLLQLLLFDVRFRIVLTCLFIFFVCGLLFLPKMWTTSPKGFLPIVKVSALDLVQAWSLKRNALRLMEVSEFEHANQAWQNAVANNPADPELLRNYLRCFLKSEAPRTKASPAFQQSFWLLRLAQTNLSDLELTAQLFEHYRYSEFLISLLQSHKDKFTPALESTYLKALFNIGQVQEFNTRWNQVGAKLAADQELPYYHLAYLAGWGPVQSQSEARQKLEAAFQDPACAILAHQLQLAVSLQLVEPERYQASLQRLEEKRQDTQAEHINYWRLLTKVGRRPEAVELARTSAFVPASAWETVELAQIHSQLGLHKQALDVLKRYVPEYGYTARPWVTYANSLMEARQWEELRSIALKIRTMEGVKDRLAGYSYYLEGRAELALGRHTTAEMAFRQIPVSPLDDNSVASIVANDLLKLSYPAIARDLLQKREKDFVRDFNYWMLLFSAADQLKDVDLMLSASSKAYQLNPNDPIIVNNHAAALLISRQQPDEVIKLTLLFVSQNPDSILARINHSAALLLNGRPLEAEKLLKTVNTSELTRSQIAIYNLDLFEMHLALQQYELAWKTRNLIEPQFLYPTQRKWLEEAEKLLPARPADKA